MIIYNICPNIQYCQENILVIESNMRKLGYLGDNQGFGTAIRVGSNMNHSEFGGEYEEHWHVIPTAENCGCTEAALVSILDGVKIYKQVEENPSNFVKTEREKLMTLYRKFEEDGRDYYLNLQAEMKQDYDSGSLPVEAVFHIENVLDPVKSKVITGDWISAVTKLAAIPVDAYFQQSLKDRLIDDANNYIFNNYPPQQ